MEDPVAKDQKLASEAAKNWRYYQRFHFHATGIAAMSLGLLLLLVLVNAPIKYKNTAAYLVAVGGFLYPFVWLFAGIYGPEMGRHAAKEAFAFFGWMGGVFLIGAILEFILIAKYPLSLNKANQ
jgi:Mn2+/Fe2+ NRAMP family transporter